jgi:hypothetical protein
MLFLALLQNRYGPSATVDRDVRPTWPNKLSSWRRNILRASRTKETARERAHIANMARMMQDEAGKKFTIVMADQLLKIHNPIAPHSAWPAC